MKEYKSKNIRIKNNIFSFYDIQDNSRYIKNYIFLKQLYDLTVVSWGDFGVDFIKDHVINCKYLLLVFTIDKKLVAYAAVNEKFYLSKKFYYFEFLIIHPEYQKLGLGDKIIKYLYKKILLKNLILGKLSINLITISPNPRILGILSRRSLNMYPNPKFFKNGHINEANDDIWFIAQEVLKNSYNPNRKLDRQGLVLHDSYKSIPWLIYNFKNVPWDYNKIVNDFCNTYLEYKNKKGKEFIIIAKIGILSL